MAAPESLDREVWLDAPGLCTPVQLGWINRRPSRTGDVIAFAYTDLWLDGAMHIAPFELDADLPLVEGWHYARKGANDVTAAFHDCSPDRWGRLLMDRREAAQAGANGRPVKALRAWDYLLGVDDFSRMGALRLRDPGSGAWLADGRPAAPPLTDLRKLESVAAKVEAGSKLTKDEETRWLVQLVAPGASLGGARPKAGYQEADGSLWLAKFPGRDDSHDVGLWEFITCKIACLAGIVMPEASLLKLSARGHTFAVKRFDRVAGERMHYASAFTLLDADQSEGHSYLDIAQLIEDGGTQGGIAQDLEQLFRRVLFNVLVGNRDDHLRNHGFLRTATGWSLSPAFDINPNTASDAHVLALDAYDPSPGTGHVLATAALYQLTQERAARIEQEVRHAVRQWQAVARTHGARRSEMERMAEVIDPDR